MWLYQNLLSGTDYLIEASSTVFDTYLTKWLLLMLGSSIEMMTLFMCVLLYVKDNLKWWTEAFRLRNYLHFVSPFNFAFILNSVFTLDITWSLYGYKYKNVLFANNFPVNIVLYHQQWERLWCFQLIFYKVADLCIKKCFFYTRWR